MNTETTEIASTAVWLSAPARGELSIPVLASVRPGPLGGVTVHASLTDREFQLTLKVIHEPWGRPAFAV